ncbi:MAG: hypothetical protein LH630_02150 [Actinomycetia bacterium]|nr:hypothetical protein [Actinomycetes bacterium]
MGDLVGIERQSVERVDQRHQRGLGQAFLVAPRCVSEDAGEAVWVGLLEPPQGGTDVCT